MITIAEDKEKVREQITQIINDFAERHSLTDIKIEGDFGYNFDGIKQENSEILVNGKKHNIPFWRENYKYKAIIRISINI